MRREQAPRDFKMSLVLVLEPRILSHFYLSDSRHDPVSRLVRVFHTGF